MSNTQQNKPHAEVKPEEQTEPVTQNAPLEQATKEEPLETDVTLESIWKQIKTKAVELGPRINQAVQVAEPILVDDKTIKLHITAESHKDLYDKHKKSIYEVLSKELGIKNLVFTYELVESELERKRPLKDAEKYQSMVEENAALKLLKDKFDLDIKK